MPSDNLEIFIKEKIQAVQHTPPPASNWDPEATWLKLQQNPVPARKKSWAWHYYAAAVVLFGLMLGVLRLNRSNTQPQPGLATTPSRVMVPPTASAPTLPQRVNEPIAPNTHPSRLTAPPNPVVASGRRAKFRVEHSAVDLTQNTTKLTKAVAAAINQAPEPEIVPATNLVPSASEPTTTALPIKITVVLGAASSAKMLNQTANITVPNKKRNKRLRFNLPSSESSAKDVFALTDSAYKFPRLQAKIDF